MPALPRRRGLRRLRPLRLHARPTTPAFTNRIFDPESVDTFYSAPGRREADAHRLPPQHQLLGGRPRAHRRPLPAGLHGEGARPPTPPGAATPRGSSTLEESANGCPGSGRTSSRRRGHPTRRRRHRLRHGLPAVRPDAGPRPHRPALPPRRRRPPQHRAGPPSRPHHPGPGRPVRHRRLRARPRPLVDAAVQRRRPGRRDPRVGADATRSTSARSRSPRRARSADPASQSPTERREAS